MIVADLLFQILAGLIIAAIIGAAGSFVVLIKCVHKQAVDISLIKKASIVAFKLIAEDTHRLHGDQHTLTDIDEIYEDLTDNPKS